MVYWITYICLVCIVTIVFEKVNLFENILHAYILHILNLIQHYFSLLNYIHLHSLYCIWNKIIWKYSEYTYYTFRLKWKSCSHINLKCIAAATADKVDKPSGRRMAHSDLFFNILIWKIATFRHPKGTILIPTKLNQEVA